MGESNMQICNSLPNNCYLVEIFNDTSGILLILPSSLPSDVSVITQVDCHQNQFPPLLYVSYIIKKVCTVVLVTTQKRGT